jgi:DNA-binding PadR family transcriptional regulator
VGAGLTFGVFYGVRRRRHARASVDADGDDVAMLPSGPFGPAPGFASVSAAVDEGAAAAIAPVQSEVASVAVASGAGASLTPILETTTPPIGIRPLRTRAPRAPGEEPRRWSRDVVAYLGTLPTLGPDDIATIDWTQKGMSDRLGTGQNQISNVLRRLVGSGIVIEQLEHVQGQPRRLKVYRLTMRGETLAREVRRRRPSSNPNLLRSEW